MRQRIDIAVYVVTLMIAGALALPTAIAQNPAAPPSLQEQLEAQYKLAKVTGGTVVESGTVLVLQKAGVLGVAPGKLTSPVVTYKDGTLQSSLPPAGRAAGTGNPQPPPITSRDTHPLLNGEKVYVSNIRVNPTDEAISFEIHECDTCNGASQPSSYWSTVTFLFAKGYLEAASVPEVEDTIGQVLAADTSQAEVPQVPPPTPPEPAAPGPANPSQGLTNAEIIKMVQVKLGDAVIIAKIKSSVCAFDTSADGLVRLKQAGASDAVLQAMIDAGNQPTGPPPASPPSESQTPSGCTDYPSCIQSANVAFSAMQWDQSLANLQAATILDPTRPDAWASLGHLYLAKGQYQDAATMWDKALGLGGTVYFAAWHLRGLGYDVGNFLLSAKQVSFVRSGQQIVFSGAVSEVSSVKVQSLNKAFNMKMGGREYRIFFAPVGVQCTLPYQCSDPSGYRQEATVAKYMVQAFGRLAPGSVGK